MNSYIALALVGALSACTPAMMGTAAKPPPCPDTDAVVKKRVIETTLQREPQELGRAHGIWRDFYDDGQIREVGCYHHGEQAGEWRQFYPDGKIRSVRTYGGPGCDIDTN